MDRTPTSQRLAEELSKLKPMTDGLRKVINRARAGYYDDYKSSHATPQALLVQDLYKIGHPAFAQRVIDGEFDAQEWEAEEWVNSIEGKALFADAFTELVKAIGDIHPSQEHDMRQILDGLLETQVGGAVESQPRPIEGPVEDIESVIDHLLAKPEPPAGYQYLDLSQAKIEVVQPITEASFGYLIDLVNGRKVDLADAIMIGHNLHCWLIQAIEQSVGLDNRQKLELRKIALSTFARAMEERP